MLRVCGHDRMRCGAMRVRALTQSGVQPADGVQACGANAMFSTCASN